MYPNHHLPLIAGLFLLLGFSSNALARPDVGAPAPELGLLDQHGKRHQLSDYAGKWLVLYFYPKDDTPGCTTQACEFRDDIFILRKMGVAVVGVSLDDVDSHKAFAEKYKLPFPLLADMQGKVSAAYGALSKFGWLKFAKRVTFIVGPDGMIAKVYPNVKPKTHSDRVIADIKRLSGN